MNYTQNACCEGICAEPMPVRESTLTDMQQKASAMAEDILMLTRRLSHHFFGMDNLVEEDKPSMPDCFRNDLYWEIQTLHLAIDGLQRMIDEIGA